MQRILVVDDDPHICLAIRAWLRRYGFRVAVAEGGTAGLIALDDFDVRSDDRRYIHAEHAWFRVRSEYSAITPRKSR